jgi:hypothetical protein
MDRRWVNGRLFSSKHINSVNEFMSFIQGKFSESDEILCPCCSYLNQKYLSQPLVKKHILLNGMECGYTRWIQHGEGLDVEFVEHPLDGENLDEEHRQDNADPNDNGDCFINVEGVIEGDSYGDDHFEGMLRGLQNAGGQVRHDRENLDGKN